MRGFFAVFIPVFIPVFNSVLIPVSNFRGRLLPLRLGLLAVLAWGWPAVLPAAPAAEKSAELPVYRFTVHLDTSQHTIGGRMVLELAPDDPRWRGDIWFHLPPNRFLRRDQRGRRRNIESLTFESGFRLPRRGDPVWPSGFSPGGVKIERITTAGDRELTFSFEDNPRLPNGFHPGRALLRVRLGAAAAGGGKRMLIVYFTTRLPRRYWEGWSKAGILAEQWHPVLANFKKGGEAGQWEFDPFAPRPGLFEVNLTVDREGRVFMGRAQAADVSPRRSFHLPLDREQPLRSLPLVFVTTPNVIASHGYDFSLYSFYGKRQQRVGKLALDIGNDFLIFMREKYGLPPPASRIAIIAADIPPGDIRTIGNIVLVPEDFYSNHRVLDRIFLAQLARALAQIWFGEALWSNRDRQSWLHLGLPGYLAMEYFQSLFGWNAGIHAMVDWLQPKFREHFFEAPVRNNMNAKRDAPLLISLSRYHREQVARLNAHNKGPLIFRGLFYVMGPRVFRQALSAFYFKHRFSVVTSAGMAKAFSDFAGTDLRPFFQEWFKGTPLVDFAVKSVVEKKTPRGVLVTARLARTGGTLLPVEVRATSEAGDTHSVRWEAGAETIELEFELQAPLESVQIDPDEYWLELDRKNNHSQTLFRLRPFFDWPKQREVLVTLRGTAGNNNVDGNYLGLGARVLLNDNNQLDFIPIWGERTGYTNYRASWARRHFLFTDLTLNIGANKLRGLEAQTLRLSYTFFNSDAYLIRSGIEFNFEEVDAIFLVDRGVGISQPKGRANNVRYDFDFFRRAGLYYGGALRLSVTDSHPGYDSDFEFTTFHANLNQTLYLGESYSVALKLIRGGSKGTPPIQKRHDLSGPLRGYPRVVNLAFEEIHAASLDLGVVLARGGSSGKLLKIRKVTGFLFGDVGRGWNNGERPEDRPWRKDAGIGLEVWVNLLRLTEFPVSMAVAYPIGDPEYTEPQFILFGVFRF